MRDADTGRLWTPLFLGAVLGPALQLQQAQPWPWAGSVLLVCAALLAGWVVRRARGCAGAAWLAVCAAACAFGLSGLRAAVYLGGALDPALEGRDLHITGTIAAMPQRNELGQRFRFEVEHADDAGAPVRLPARLSLAWYAGAWAAGAGSPDAQRAAPELHAGERWRMTVRLRAPHGNLNPHGFDYELWLWEQGLQATGSVRAGPNDAPPQRLAATWSHPIEQARQAVRGAILARVADAQSAGVIAALVVGDQNAIELGTFFYCLLLLAGTSQRGEPTTQEVCRDIH